MNKQTQEMSTVYSQELEEVERAYLVDREALMNAQENELNDLLTKRQDLEQGFMEKKAKEIRKSQATFDDERAKEAEEYNFMKIMLETTVQKLEQDFQQIQATFQLNHEKLDYNYQILY